MSPPLALPPVADQALGAHGHLPTLHFEQLHAVAVPAAGAILKVAIPAGAQDADLREEAHTKEGEEGQGYGREGGCTTGQPCYSRCR